MSEARPSVRDSVDDAPAREIAAGERFPFGENWRRFLGSLDERRVRQAEDSLRRMLGVESLAGRRFLDAGSGSGLFSLAARRLGATVHSFDFDPASVACTEELRRRYHANDPAWTVEQGSVLNADYLASLGTFDVVYSWGVLHHTGDLWRALGNVAALVAPGGTFFVAIYNDQGWISRYWTAVKRLYNHGPLARFAVIVVHVPYLIGVRWFIRFVTRRPPLARGMSLWHDMLDWLGGYPFEVASPAALLAQLGARNFTLARAVTCGRRHGCNELVLTRAAAA